MSRGDYVRTPVADTLEQRWPGEYLDNTGHKLKCSLKETKILDKEDRVSRKRIKGAIRIHDLKGGLN